MLMEDLPSQYYSLKGFKVLKLNSLRLYLIKKCNLVLNRYLHELNEIHDKQICFYYFVICKIK